MKSKSLASWVIAGSCFVTFAAWALMAAYVIMHQGDRMIGFHPLILTALPGVAIGALSAIILLIFRQWQIGLALGVGTLTLFLVIRNGHALEEHAWRQAIILHAQSNQRAMSAIKGDVEGDDLSPLWEEEKLTALEDFRWYGTNHISAPNGVYFGFRIGGVPHVRIQKIRGGWMGVALIPSESALEALSKRTVLKYSAIGFGDWFVWGTD